MFLMYFFFGVLFYILPIIFFASLYVFKKPIFYLMGKSHPQLHIQKTPIIHFHFQKNIIFCRLWLFYHWNIMFSTSERINNSVHIFIFLWTVFLILDCVFTMGLYSFLFCFYWFWWFFDNIRFTIQKYCFL